MAWSHRAIYKKNNFEDCAHYMPAVLTACAISLSVLVGGQSLVFYLHSFTTKNDSLANIANMFALIEDSWHYNTLLTLTASRNR